MTLTCPPCPGPGRHMPADEPSSQLSAWLGRHRAGDADARDGLLQHSQERLKVLTRQMLRRFPDVRRWEDTSDVFQNVLIRLDRALGALTFDTSADFLRLAACLIRRELIDLSRLRRPAFLPARAADQAPDRGRVGEPAVSTDDPYELALWHEVHTRIDGLPEEDRLLFDLLYYQGLSQPEAAALLGVPLRTLKRSWQSARARLMLALGNEPPF